MVSVAREKRKLPEQELQELKILLDSINQTIIDNNQNVSDALQVVKELKTNLGLDDEKPTFLQRLRKLVVNK